jgi:hypothetical protein
MTYSILLNLPLKLEGDPIELGYLDGYKLAAPKSFWENQAAVNEVVNGCGPGGFGDFVVPDTVWFLNIKPACKVHDWMFTVYNCLEGFELSNDIFHDNMERINRSTKNKYLRWLRSKRIEKYKDACSSALGRLFYFDAHVGLYDKYSMYGRAA